MYKPKILIIGALPPPYIGPSVANQKLIHSNLLNDTFMIRHLDTSDRRVPENIGKFDLINAVLAIRHIWECIIQIIFYIPQIVYLPISQNLWGLLRDLGFIIPAILSRRKIVIHLRGSEFNTTYRSLPVIVKLITRWAFKHVSKVIVLGKSVRLVFDGLVENQNVVVVPNGIDYHPFKPNGQATNRKGILYLSSLLERKGIYQFIKSLSLVLKLFPQINITVAGTWQSKEEKKKLDLLIEKYKIGKKISFVGEVDTTEKIKLYHTHSIFVFPPIQPEGLPWVVLEAMSAALPVITTAQGTIPEVVEDQKSGFIIEPTPENIANKICYLLENPNIAKEMGEKGSQRIKEHFSEELYFERLKKVFLESLQS